MNLLTRMLDAAGRRGPHLLFGGVLAGLALPALAAAARPFMGLAVFLFTLGAFMKVDVAAFRQALGQRRWLGALLLWSTFGVPAAALLIVKLVPLPGDAAQGLMLCMFAPPVGSAAALAAMLGLSPVLALLATVTATLAAPMYLPPLAAFAGELRLAIDPVDMGLRLGAIVGAAGLIAAGLRRYAGAFVRRNPQAMTGIAVVGLLLVALGAMQGMQEFVLADPLRVVELLALAFIANAAFQLLGLLLFHRWGRCEALTAGLVSGNRNVTLAWVAAAPSLIGHPGVELFIAMSVFPIFMLPALTRALLRRYPAFPLAWRGTAGDLTGKGRPPTNSAATPPSPAAGGEAGR